MKIDRNRPKRTESLVFIRKRLISFILVIRQDHFENAFIFSQELKSEIRFLVILGRADDTPPGAVRADSGFVDAGAGDGAFAEARVLSFLSHCERPAKHLVVTSQTLRVM